jgi:N-acetylmuramoyl-L-alanine amidase
MAGNSSAVAMMEEAAALMRDAGLTVLASSGWKDRGRSGDVSYWAALAHHTAGTDDNDSLLINGRSDLPGPLCNWALHENGDWVLIASGRANHAGEGTLSNSESQGIEATGPQDYPDTYGPGSFPGNYDSYEVGAACLLAAMDADVDDLFGHKETARPVGRKIDPYFDMGAFRKGVSEGGEDELSAADVKTGVSQALEEFFHPDGIIPGQNSYADHARVDADRLAKILTEQQKTNSLLQQLIDAQTRAAGS